MKATISKLYCMAMFAFCFFIFNTVQAAAPQISYQVHVAGYGWLKWVSNGAGAGTTGQGRQMEAIRIRSNVPIIYQVHVAGYGWLDWVSNGEGAGTTGQGRQMEAIRIKIAGNYARKFNVYYRVHVAGYGWLNWVSNGKVAGTTGQGRQIEAIQIRLEYK